MSTTSTRSATSIDRVQLTPVAIAEGMVVADNLFNGSESNARLRRRSNGRVLPAEHRHRRTDGSPGATNSMPNVRIFESTFRPMKHTMSGRNERTMMKLVVDADTDRVVGAHMVGPDAGEIIQGLGVALKAGATKAQFDSTIGIHPTAAEEFVTMREPVR